MTEGTTQPLWMLRAVVTGGAGFVGSWVCERLLALGAHVICVDDLSEAGLANVEHLRERPRFQAVHGAADGGVAVDGPVDWVLHLGWPDAPADPRQMPLGAMRTGCVATAYALDLATDKDARFVLACSSDGHGEPEGFVEGLSAAYRSELDVDTGIVRVVGAFGPRMRLDDAREVPTLVRQALNGEPLTVAGDGSQTRVLCYADDVATGIVAMAMSDDPGPVVLGGEEVTVLALAEQVLRISGSTSPIHFVDPPADGLGARRLHAVPSAPVPGWRPSVGVAAGLEQTVRWAESSRAALRGA
jgi:dTDP-glucose 4,6-dehydratase